MFEGRNEHMVKNRFISILRSLKKQGGIFNPNNPDEVFNEFKKVKFELDSIKIEQIPTESKKFPNEFPENFPHMDNQEEIEFQKFALYSVKLENFCFGNFQRHLMEANKVLFDNFSTSCSQAK